MATTTANAVKVRHVVCGSSPNQAPGPLLAVDGGAFEASKQGPPYLALAAK